MTFVFTNPSQSFSKTGRSAEDIIQQSGDVMKGDFPVANNINENNLSSPVNMVTTKGKQKNYDHPMIRNSEYSSPQVALGGSRLSIPTMSKTGSIGIGGNNGGNILSTPPQFYSPIHTPTNWQIPTKRREVYLWSLPVDFTELTSFDFTHKNINDLDFVVDNVIEDTLTSGKVYSLSDSFSIISGDGSPSSPIRYYDIDDNEESYIDVSFIGTHHKVYGHKDHPIYVLPHKGKNGYFRTYRRFVENRRYKGFLGGHNFREEAEKTKWEIKKKSFSEINKKDWGLIPIGKFENNYAEYSSDFFYTVGLLLADGFKTYNDKEKLHGSGIGITFDTTRPEIIDFIKNFLSEKYPNNIVFERPNPPSEKCISLRIKSVDAFSDFDKFVCGTYAQKKIRIPFTDLNKEQTLNLIAGYFDGDGCYNKVDDLLQIPSISEDISNQIYYACLYTGMSSTINKYTVPESWKKFGKVSSETFTTVTIPSCSLDIIKKYSKTNKIPKERKYKRNVYYLKGGFFLTDKDNQRYFARRIKNIKKFKYTGKSFDLEIPINHSYCVSGFKVSNCRFFSNNNPTIKASLRFYSQFPFSGYDHIISDSIRKEHFDNLKKRLRLEDLMPQIAYEYFAMGDAFPFISISCPKCNGWGTTPDGEPCDHAGGEIGSVTLINPDLIDVKNNPLNPAHSVITLVPDPALESIIYSQQPKEIYDTIPDHIKKLIASKQPIPLDPQRVTHLKHDQIAYQTYGQSVIVPLFPILAYLDRLRQAQWIIAERHILPIKICKVGTEQRPAGPQDIANVQQQLAATANDPNLTLVTHHAFDFCHDSETDVMTENGWKKYWDVSDDEKIMVFDKNTEEMRLENYTNRYESIYNGEMICFNNSNIDICVTPNHKMLYQETKGMEWKVGKAQYISEKHRRRFRSIANWKSDLDIKFVEIKVEENLQKDFGISLEQNIGEIPIDIFLKFVGYYLSEGYSQFSEKSRLYQVSISQNLNSKYHKEMKDSLSDFCSFINKTPSFNINKSYYRKNEIEHMLINSKVLTYYMKKEFGGTARYKKIPKWIKNLPSNKLRILLDAFNSGDASINDEYKCGNYYQVSVFSDQLVEDIAEIAFKCGYSPTITRHSSIESYPNGLLCANFGDGPQGRYPVIKQNQITKKNYNGLIWCFETSTGFFVTRRNGKIAIQGNSWTGAAGKVLQLTKEYDMVDKDIIKGLGVSEALLSGCIPEESRLLTNNGFKSLNNFDIENDLLATINHKTHVFEFQKATKLHIFDHNSIDGEDRPLIHFKNSKKLDNIFTHNHDMYGTLRNHREHWAKIPAKEVKHKTKFMLKTNGWNDGQIPQNINDLTLGIPLKLFLRLAAFFIAEGSYIKEYNRKEKTGETYICSETGRKRTNRKKIGISLVQSIESDIIDDFFDLEEKINQYNFNIHHWVTQHNDKNDSCCFRLNSIMLANKFLEYFGEYAENKKIPNWIKNLPSEYLEILLYYLVKTDGSERSDNKRIKNNKKQYITYDTTSEQLCGDVCEILLKIKQSPRFSIIDPNIYKSAKKLKTKAFTQYSISWSPDSTIGDQPEIRHYKNRKTIYEKKYKGKVWCVTVPNGLILCENNGKMIWTGNSGPSYGQAAIGIEATIKRLKTVQNLLAWWVTEKIYKAEAKIKGFYKEDKLGRKVLDYPKIRWDDLNLRDETQKNNMYLQLWDKGIVSTQFICEKLDIDYNNEVEKVRMEQQYQLQLGISPQSKGGAKGGLGGGFSGGTGGGLMGGSMPGGMDAPGLPGDDLAPSLSGGEGGGGTPSGGTAMESDDIQLKMKNFELAKAIKPMVHRPSKYKIREPKQPKQVQPEPKNELFVGPRNGSFNLTSIERTLYSSIIEAQKVGQLPEDFVWQEKPEPSRMSRVVVDGIFPSIRLIVEADGKQFHSAPDDIAKDQERDAKLARYGWTVIRFTEEEIENRIEDVIATIIKFVREMSNDENENLAFSKNDLVKIANNIYIEKNNYKAMYTVANVKEQKSEQDQITEFLIYIINHTASDVHDDWRKTRFNKENEEYEPRIKKTEDKKWIEENETDEVDIANTEYKNLPEDWQVENKISSQIAVWRICEAIKNNLEIDDNSINEISNDIHSAWIDRHPEAEEELKVPYDELSEEEKDKDRLFVEKALNNINKLKVNINL